MSYNQLSPADAKAFLAANGLKRTGPHRMTQRLLNYMYCANCGLLNLKNDVTRAALKKVCMWED
jgi:hypothetical protein